MYIIVRYNKLNLLHKIMQINYLIISKILTIK
jgi:hypothetical protein